MRWGINDLEPGNIPDGEEYDTEHEKVESNEDLERAEEG